MNWDDLRVFDAAARLRGVTAAARALGLSQPQMSRRLRRFEDRMGARLFDRTPNGLMLTPAGEKLLPIIQNMREIAENVERVQPELASKAQKVVRISLDELREHFIARHMSWLQQQIGDVEIELYSAQLHLNHASRETEIQLRSCLPESETLIARKMANISYHTYVSRDYKEKANLPPLQDPNWIGFSPDRLWYPEIKQWMDSNLAAAPIVRCNTITGQLNAAISGAGYAILPAFMADPVAQLQRVTGLENIYTSTEHLIVHRDLLREPA
ncbi:hypothetical protein MNBD_ALPHA08-506, partial [hydrothermal vent metagenome]